MKYLAAYALLVLGGKPNPTANEVKTLLQNVQANVNEADLKKVIESLSGKQLHELIASGVKKVGASSGAPAAKAAVAAEKKDEKKDVKKETKKEQKKPKVEQQPVDDDFGLGGGLFD